MDDGSVVLLDLAREAGFLAAHAVWCVSDGATLIPFVGMELERGKRNLVRFLDEEDLGRAVALARAAFESNSNGALLATLIYDGYVTLADGKTDALMVDGRVYCEPPIGITMAVPYRHAEHPRGFAVYRPKFTGVVGPEPIDYEAVSRAFFDGVDGHDRGAEVWNRCIDQSR
jgi:hypothetical protein